MDTTFYAFQSNIRYFLNSLSKNPIKAQPSDFLKERGFNKNKLINILLKRDVIRRHEHIDDNDEKVNYKVKYKIVRDKFERKLKRIYNKYFEENKEEAPIEEATACCGGGAGAENTASGPFVTALGLVRREIKECSNNKTKRNIYITEKQFEVLKEALATSNAGDYQYTAPISIKKNDPSMKRGKKGESISMKRLKK